MVRKAITNIRNVLTKQQTEIMSVAGMLMVIGIVTKVFGLLYNSLAAGYLGPDVYNQYVFAANIPELISQIILFGSISAAVLPILSAALDKGGEARFTRVFSTVINSSLLFFSLIALLISLGAHIIMPWFIDKIIQPETQITPEAMSEMISMLRVLLIPQVILGLSIYLSTALNLYERFVVPQLAPLFYNLGRIAAIYLMLPILGKSPWVLVWGTIIGAVIHLLIQIPLLNHIGIKYRPILDLKDEYIHKIATASLPRVVSMSAEQIGVTVDKFIAFALVGNSLALYNLAVLVISVPLSLVGSSFATASFPALSRAFVKKDRILAGQIFLRIINQILFFAVPAAVLLLVLRVPIARLTFGIFGSEIRFLETYTIAWVILFFAPGIILESLRTFLYRTFYAAHDTVRPLVVSVIVLTSGAISGIAFTNYFSHFSEFNLNQFFTGFNSDYFFERSSGVAAVGGLGLSSSLVFTLEAVILIMWLNKVYLKMGWQEIVIPILKKLAAGIAMGVFTYFVFKIWAGLTTSERTAYLIILTITTSAASAMIYIAISGILRIEEVNVYIKFLSMHPNIPTIKRILRNFKMFEPLPIEEGTS